MLDLLSVGISLSNNGNIYRYLHYLTIPCLPKIGLEISFGGFMWIFWLTMYGCYNISGANMT